MAKGADVLSERVLPENIWAWSAFQALRGSRQVGFSTGPIPITEITAYCDLIGLADPVQKIRLARFVMALDRVERQFYGSNAKGQG